MILFSLIAAALIGLMYWFGYVDGKQRGYKKGKQDAEQAELNWWTKAESFRLNEGNVKRHSLERLDSMVCAVVGKRLTFAGLTA